MGITSVGGGFCLSNRTRAIKHQTDGRGEKNRASIVTNQVHRPSGRRKNKKTRGFIDDSKRRLYNIRIEARLPACF